MTSQNVQSDNKSPCIFPWNYALHAAIVLFTCADSSLTFSCSQRSCTVSVVLAFLDFFSDLLPEIEVNVLEYAVNARNAAPR